jgi:Domain of unknown function (DUF5076)
MTMNEPGYRLDVDALGMDLSQDIEVARIFVSPDEGTLVVVNPKAVEEAFAFGVICVDFMKHAAEAFARDRGCDSEEAFQGILRGVMSELQDPTGEVSN